MQEYQQRVVDEKKVLDDKLRALNGFLSGELVTTIRADEQYRMARQAEIMERYSRILGERIKFFEEQDKEGM
jgi:hypothetical protein